VAQTVANFGSVMKDVWTSSKLEKQFYDENPLLDRIEKTSRFTIGQQAQVPIHKGRSGGYSVKSSAGGTLNAADEQKVDQAVYTLSYNYQQVSLETGVLNQGAGGNQSVASAMDLEVTGAIADMRKQVMRQAVSNGDARIANFTTTTATTPLNLDPTGYGYDAIVRGWIYPGLQVDIGTAANEVLRADGYFITAVSEDATTPTITVSTTDGGSAASLTTASTDFLSIKDARAGTTSNEMNGLRSIAGSNTTVVGGINPATAGEEFWKPAYVDTTTTTISLDLLLTLRRKVEQKTGARSPVIATSLDQYANLESLLQNQVRFSNPGKLGVNDATLNVNGVDVLAVNDIPARELYCLNLDDMFILTGKFSKPTWMSDIEGAGGRLRWAQGATNLVDSVVYALNLGISRRNSMAAAIGLTA
jgi:hypothetical protein